MMLRRPFLLLLLTISLAGFLAACGSGDAADTGDALRVVATTGMVADVVSQVGGEHVVVVQLMGPGVDPHLYKATESDVNKLANANAIFYSGLHLEARMVDVFEQISRSKPAIPIADAIPAEQLLASPTYAAQFDPHVWMDPKLWSLTIDAVREALIELAPEHEADFRANAASYRTELDKLDRYVAEQVARTPADKRVLITAHDAFHYFGQGYDYEVFAPQGISTAAEAGVDDIRRTIDLAVERDIPAVFVESSVPPDIVEAIVEGARSRGHELKIGGSLFSDAMGDPGTPEGTYVGMIRHNIDTIVAPLVE